MSRRDIILAGLGVAAFGAAEALRPRKRLVLLKDTTVELTLPLSFSGWVAQPAQGLVSPEQAGRLAQTLYSEIVSRVYVNEATGAAIMMLAAYGDTQSDLLQLHRPESCYPAVGYALRSARSVDLPLPGRGTLPARQVVASREAQIENILYWTRMGEMLPRTGREQRVARLQNAIRGYVPDGILMRCSLVQDDAAAAFKTLDGFVTLMLQAVPSDRRSALIGTELAKRFV
jgi:EpsI family protein